MWTRKELKARARMVLRFSYWKAFLVSLILVFVGGGKSGGSYNFNLGGNHSQNLSHNFSGSSSSFFPYFLIFGVIFILVLLVVLAFRVFLGYPLEVGGRRFFVQAANNDVDLNNLGFAFDKQRYFDIIKAMLWRALINFLWYLLLIIPGIIKSYAYRMVPYILADNPNIGYRRALELSNTMTDHHKFKMFILDISFIGWYILGAIALFVGVLFVLPYVNATNAELYLTLRQDALDKGLCSYQELELEI